IGTFIDRRTGIQGLGTSEFYNFVTHSTDNPTSAPGGTLAALSGYFNGGAWLQDANLSNPNSPGQIGQSAAGSSAAASITVYERSNWVGTQDLSDANGNNYHVIGGPSVP